MMTALAWLLEHKRLSGEALLALALVALGWWLHKPHPCPSCAPAVHVVEQEHKAKDSDTKRETETEAGPTRKVKLTFDPHCPPPAAAVQQMQAQLAAPPGAPVQLGSGILMQPPPGLLSAELTVTGPRETVTHAETESHATADKHIEMQVTPPPAGPGLPRFSVSWEPRVLPGLGLGVVGAGVRVTQDLWIDGWAEPTAPVVGLGVRVTW